MVGRWQEYAAEIMAEDVSAVDLIGCSLVDTGEYAEAKLRRRVEDAEGWERDERDRIVGGWVQPYSEEE